MTTNPNHLAQSYAIPAEVINTSNYFATQAIQSSNALTLATDKIFHLESQIAQMQAAEDAFTQILEQDDRLFVIDRTNRLVELLNHRVAECIHFIPDAPFSVEQHYQITLDGVNPVLCLSLADYYNDRRLLNALAELPNVHVSLLRRSVGLTAIALRLAFAKKTRVVFPHFWGGWLPTQNQQFAFFLTSENRTHTTSNLFSRYHPLTNFPTSAEAIFSFQNFWDSALSPIQNSQLKWLVSLCLHTSCLYSLIRQLQQPLNCAFCFFNEDAATLEYFKSLFQQGNDIAFSLDLPPASFTMNLLERKDQTMVVLDKRTTPNAKANATLLQNTLQTAQILWKNRREERFFPLQALPIILTSSSSSLSCAPHCLVIDLDCNDLDISTWLSTDGKLDSLVSEHIFNFLKFAQQNIPALQELLETMQREVLRGKHDLSASSLQTMGILLAVDAFLGKYLKLFHLDYPESAPATDACKNYLLNLLQAATDQEYCCTDIVGQFISIVRADFMNHTLHAQPRNSPSSPSSNVVFFTENTLFFSASAFYSLCKRLSCSRPMLVRALASSGLIQGTPINDTTRMTRIRVANEGGSHRTESVYALLREAFDLFGDPLIFEEEII